MLDVRSPVGFEADFKTGPWEAVLMFVKTTLEIQARK